MSINPYEPPSEPPSESDPTVVHEISADHIGYEFAADWGPDGIRHRLVGRAKRESPMGVLFAGVTVLIIFLIFSPIRGLAALACPLMFVWFVMLIAWVLPQLFSRSPPSNLYGFSGAVRGEITTTHLLVRGPFAAILSRRPVPHPFIFRSNPQVYLPFFSKMIPLLTEDLIRPITRGQASDETKPIETLKRWCDLPKDQLEIRIDETLRGTDLAKTAYRIRWIVALIVVGTIFTLVAVFGILILLKVLGLNFMRLFEADIAMSREGVAAVGCLVIMITVISGFLTKSLMDKVWGPHGRFQALVCESTFIIYSEQLQRCYAFQGESLGHFNVTQRGVEVKDLKSKLAFLLPSKWFTNEELDQIQKWQSTWSKPERDTYFGPQI